MTQFQIATNELHKWLTNHDTVTTLELKNSLIQNHPAIYWTQQWVSAFMQNTELEFTDNGRYRTYFKTSLSLEVLQDVVEEFTSLNRPITKEALKKELVHDGFALGNFKELFAQLNLQHSGKYTADNKKIWVYVPTGKHLSKGKQSLVSIKDMPKPYLRNAIAKYVADNGQPDMHYILGQPTSEFYKLLQAFFTWEIRNAI